MKNRREPTITLTTYQQNTRQKSNSKDRILVSLLLTFILKITKNPLLYYT